MASQEQNQTTTVTNTATPNSGIPEPCIPSSKKSLKCKKAPNWSLDDDLSFLRLTKKHSFNYATVVDDMKNNQHHATQNGFDAEKAPKKYNNLNNAGKYKRKYEQKPFKPKKKQHVDKNEELKEMAIHAENEAKICKVHDEIVDILRELRDDEVLLSTEEAQTEKETHDAIINAGIDRKAKRNEKIERWATSHEAEVQFHEKMVDSAARMEQHWAKAITQEERRLSLLERYVVALEKQSNNHTNSVSTNQ